VSVLQEIDGLLPIVVPGVGDEYFSEFIALERTTGHETFLVHGGMTLAAVIATMIPSARRVYFDGGYYEVTR